MSTVKSSLSKGELPESWDNGELDRIVPGQQQRLAELESLLSSGGYAAFYERAVRGIDSARDLKELEERDLLLLGRERGRVSVVLADLPKLSIEHKRVVGRAANRIKAWLQEAIVAKRRSLEDEAEARAAAGADVTEPGRRPWVGRRHVLGQVVDELLDLFHGLGYSVYTSREVELDEYNFGKLNFPPDHPARDAHDTYFVEGGHVLRTHTSPGWVRAMEEQPPPHRLVFPGRVYRAEQVDASHMDQFLQIDGLYVNRNVSMADLKSTLNAFARHIYGPDARTRLVPIFFPFVEPGCQMDVSCVICRGSGHLRDGARCTVCKGSGWIELLGAGMVHPNVFRAVGYDPEVWTGFAFGMGVERIAMMRHGIAEIRMFIENDVRFLAQF